MESFGIGRTVSRALRLIVGTLPNAGAFLAIVIVASVGLTAASNLVYTPHTGGEGGLDEAGAFGIMVTGAITYVPAIILVTALTFSGSLYGLLRFAQNHPVTLENCLRAGLAKAMPTLGVIVLWYLAVIAGTMLLIAPAVIAITIWCLPIPVLINEGVGVGRCFARSRELTKGSRGKIFLLLLFAAIFSFIVSFVVLGAVAGADLAGITTAMQSRPWLYAAQVALSWISTSVINALLVSIYLETLTLKGGGPAGHLQEVFA